MLKGDQYWVIDDLGSTVRKEQSNNPQGPILINRSWGSELEVENLQLSPSMDNSLVTVSWSTE